MSMTIDDTFLNYACDILADTNKGLTGTEIVKYCNYYAIDFEVDNPVKNPDFGRFGSRVPNKRTALLRNLMAFNAEQQFRIIKELCELPQFNNNESVKNLKINLFKKYGFLATEKISETELVQKTKHWLSGYADALKHYESALIKYEARIFKRNILDDMRLSFEILVKDLLGNNKSLENQISELGTQLKTKGSSEELRNMVVKIIDYYTKFQNNHVKHNDDINSVEIEFVIELTSVVMKFLIKILGGKNNE